MKVQGTYSEICLSEMNIFRLAMSIIRELLLTRTHIIITSKAAEGI